MIIADKEHFYKIDGEVLGKMLELQKAIFDERMDKIIFHSCSLAWMLKKYNFEEINNV